jgi:hypothetical protein
MGRKQIAVFGWQSGAGSALFHMSISQATGPDVLIQAQQEER